MTSETSLQLEYAGRPVGLIQRTGIDFPWHEGIVEPDGEEAFWKPMLAAHAFQGWLAERDDDAEAMSDKTFTRTLAAYGLTSEAYEGCTSGTWTVTEPDGNLRVAHSLSIVRMGDGRLGASWRE
jgi:hypothetical protein